jgi:hypothetical protein
MPHCTILAMTSIANVTEELERRFYGLRTEKSVRESDMER